MIYRDTDNGLLYEVTEITVYASHCRFVKRLVNGSVLHEVDTTLTQIRDREYGNQL